MTTTFIKGLVDYRKKSDRPTVVTVGTFDGIHRGHQAILKTLRAESTRLDLEPVLLTFDPHPRVLVSPEDIPLLLTTIEEKEKFVPDFFDGTVLVLRFDDTLKEMSAEQFVGEILVEALGARKVIVGHDHAFGRNRSGNIAALKSLGEKHHFDVQVVQPVMHGGEPISSSRIRAAMRDDDYAGALEMLGHDYAIFGTVEKGIGLGRRLGFPTANIRYGLRKLLPREGVYSCWAQLGGRCWPGMMFIGRNYFNPQERISVEANLFDFDDDVHGEEMMLYPTVYLRANRRFESTGRLAEQLNLDKENAMRIIEKEKKDVNRQRA
ncbi:MAG: riboflavin biosynthesis protein RibF [Candidatus Zixiibacteriota bacterium]|nr:MAG: riboflavin biosynthesis protein RibF [candidate division Zixibacteria bacterium]